MARYCNELKCLLLSLLSVLGLSSLFLGSALAWSESWSARDSVSSNYPETAPISLPYIEVPSELDSDSNSENGEEEPRTCSGEKPFVMGALGDSVTVAFNSTGWLWHKRDSWSTGINRRYGIYSHYCRLKEKLQRPVKAVNLSKAGAKSEDVLEQASELACKKPDYVTLMVGTNDVCDWPARHQNRLIKFHNNMHRIVKKLVQANPAVKILMVPVPNLLHLRKLGAASSRCQFRWNLFRICKPLLHSSRTQEQRMAFEKRREDANAALQEVAANYPENISFNIGLAQTEFSVESLSRQDCFHPSGIGQALLAELTWQLGWFADLN